ncbi:unnamed protein product, partial [Choristocarpus tenellus]
MLGGEDYPFHDPNDPLDRVMDVYLADSLEDNLYLLQYPMRPVDRPQATPVAVKVKVANQKMEIEHAIEQDSTHFDADAPPHLLQRTMTHVGTRVQASTNFAFGVVRNNEFHLTPVHSTFQLRPSFQHVDNAK